MRFISRILLSLVLLVTATAAFAGETGSISGVVKDGTGLPVPGATVKVSGPQMPAGYTIVSRANGSYSFPKLLPGAYTVEAELKGLGRAAKKVNVSVDTDYQIELVLVQTAAAEVVVTAVNAEVDKKSTEVNSNFVSAEIRQLPIARNYSGLISLIPGAAGNQDAAGAVSIAGGTREENKYLIDGVNITNPGFGNLSVDTNELDIADVNVKHGAHHGRVRPDLGRRRERGHEVRDERLQGNHSRSRPSPHPSPPTTTRGLSSPQTDNYNGSAGVGFPILKDTLFGYVSGRYSKTTTSGLSATLGGVTTTQPDGTAKATDYFAKATALVGQSLQLNAGFRGLPNKSENQFDSIYDLATAAYGSRQHELRLERQRRLDRHEGHGPRAQVRPRDRGRHLRRRRRSSTTGRSRSTRTTSGSTGPTPTRPGTAATSASIRISPTATTYKRDEVKLTASYFLDVGKTQNQVKIGGGAEFIDLDFLRPSNGWGNLIYSSDHGGPGPVLHEHPPAGRHGRGPTPSSSRTT